MNENGIIGIKDFTLPGGNTPLPFRINDNIFYAVPEIPLDLLTDLASLSSKTMTQIENVESLKTLFSIMLTDESAPRFLAGLKNKDDAIGNRHIKPIMEWLLEVYGMRPTRLSDGSVNMSDVDGSTSSTDGASVVALTGPGTQPGEYSTSSTTT